jgi:hypothetical protein
MRLEFVFGSSIRDAAHEYACVVCHRGKDYFSGCVLSGQGILLQNILYHGEVTSHGCLAKVA